MFAAVDRDGLCDEWYSIASKPSVDFGIEIEENVCPFKEDNLLNFLKWIRLFSQRRTATKTLVKALFVFSDVSIMEILFDSEI